MFFHECLAFTDRRPNCRILAFGQYPAFPLNASSHRPIEPASDRPAPAFAFGAHSKPRNWIHNWREQNESSTLTATAPVQYALRGRGIPLMRALADQTRIDTSERGTQVRLTWANLLARQRQRRPGSLGDGAEARWCP